MDPEAARPSWIPFAAVATGVVSWIVVSAITGENEAWDAPWPYLVVSLAAAAALGFWLPLTPWRAGIWMAVGQAGVLLVTAEENTFILLLPPVFACYAALFALAAYAGGRGRKGDAVTPDSD